MNCLRNAALCLNILNILSKCYLSLLKFLHPKVDYNFIIFICHKKGQSYKFYGCFFSDTSNSKFQSLTRLTTIVIMQFLVFNFYCCHIFTPETLIYMFIIKKSAYIFFSVYYTHKKIYK